MPGLYAQKHLGPRPHSRMGMSCPLSLYCACSASPCGCECVCAFCSNNLLGTREKHNKPHASL